MGYGFVAVKKKILLQRITQLEHNLEVARLDYNMQYKSIIDWIQQHEKVCNTAEIHQVHQEMGEHLAKHATVESLNLSTRPIEVQPKSHRFWNNVIEDR